MELNRIPSKEEERLLDFLVKKSSILLSDDWKKNLLVRQMNDGEMGSLYLFPSGKIIEGRTFGQQVSEFQFTDLDGIEVIATLNIDENEELFELELWKMDYSKLIKFPDV